MGWCSVTLLEWTGSGYADGIIMDHSHHKDKSRQACHSHSMPFPTSWMPLGWFQRMAPRFFERGRRIFHPEFLKEASLSPVLPYVIELRHSAALVYCVCWSILQCWQYWMIGLYPSMNRFLLACSKYSPACIYAEVDYLSLLLFGMPETLKIQKIISHFKNQLYRWVDQLAVD